MKRVVLTYRGRMMERDSAEASLHRKFPGIILTPKTSVHLEAQVEDDQLELLEQDTNWDVKLLTFTEITPPSLNLKNVRAKLTGKR